MTQTEDLAQFDPVSFEHIPVLLNECLEGLPLIRPAPTLTAPQAARDIPARSPCGWMQKRAAG